MENKYQHALDYIVSKNCPKGCACHDCEIQLVCNCDMKWYIDKLQELIDKSKEFIHEV